MLSGLVCSVQKRSGVRVQIMNRQIDKIITNKSHNNDSGFTLIELIMVVTLIAIVSAVAMPSLRSWLRNADLNADVRRIYAGMQRTRIEAVKRNATAALIFGQTVAGNFYDCVSFVDNNADRVLDAGETVVFSFDLSGGVSVADNKFELNANGTNAVGFNNRGLPLNAKGGSITLLGETGTSRKIVMDPYTGRLRIE